jgi:hypothetical protein
METHREKKKKRLKIPKFYDVRVKQTYFWANQGQPTSCPLQNLIHVFLAESPPQIEENCILGLFEQKFTMGSYEVGIERAWCCRRAWEKSRSWVPKKLKIKNSSL